VENPAVRADRIVAGGGDHHAPHEEGKNRREDGRDYPPRPLLHLPTADHRRRLALLWWDVLALAGEVDGRRSRGLAHAASSRRPPSISTPISCSVTPPACSATISPSYITRMRSDSESTSSSSRETRRIARPRSRSWTSLRWRYSIAPTSRPRVGCAATSTVGSRSTSRAATSFC